jgi:hypothetical protein
MKTKTLLIATTLAALGLMATACKPKVTDTGIRYVAVKDGLNMREEASPTGTKMLTIPYRQEVQKLEEKPESFTIDRDRRQVDESFVARQDGLGVWWVFVVVQRRLWTAGNANNSSGNSVVDQFKSRSFNNKFAMQYSNSRSSYGTDMGCERAATAIEEITEDGDVPWF